MPSERPTGLKFAAVECVSPSHGLGLAAAWTAVIRLTVTVAVLTRPTRSVISVVSVVTFLGTALTQGMVTSGLRVRVAKGRKVAAITRHRQRKYEESKFNFVLNNQSAQNVHLSSKNDEQFPEQHKMNEN